MAHYAKVRDGIVIETIVASAETLAGMVGATSGYWIQTSYNTKGGVHYDPVTGEPSADQTKSLRGNYAGIGMIYDMENDVFYAKQPYASWVLNTTTWTWEAPVAKPEGLGPTGSEWQWDELTTSWVESTVAFVYAEGWDPAVKGPYVPPAPPTLPPLTEV